MKKQLKSYAGTIVKEGYDVNVARRALLRAGKNIQLKGHVHEVLFCDKYNIKPLHIINGQRANLTKSTTAHMRDVVMTKGGKVVSHAQLKDTISSSGVSKTIKQIKSGHYNKTAIFGTKETAEKITGKVTQPIHSSGISSETTKRIADKALGKFSSLKTLGSAAKSGGASGALIAAGVETTTSFIDVVRGKKSVADAAIDITIATAKGGLVGAGAAVASSFAAGLTGSVISTVVGVTVAGTTIGTVAIAAPVVMGFAGACAAGALLSTCFDKGIVKLKLKVLL